MMKNLSIFFLVIGLISCGVKKESVIHRVSLENIPQNCKCPIEIDLKDSIQLKPVKNGFYISNTGHLYEKKYRSKRYKSASYRCCIF